MNRYCINRAAFVLALLGSAHLLRGEEQSPYGIPLKPDPPPSIDGRMGEWERVPNVWIVNRKEQAVYAGNKWKTPADLSGKVWLAWRYEYLYLAVDVTDDRHIQSERGVNMWKGDHIELYLDLTPDADPQRSNFGDGQMQFGFSPGNFQHTGDSINDIAPEAVIYRPERAAAKGVLVAVQKTDTGYALEAAIPWGLLGVERPEKGMPINLEVGLSDTDGTESVQEKMMTLLTAEWQHTRSRLVSAALAPADGVAPPVARGVEILKLEELPAGAKKEFHFKGLTVPKGKDAVLSFQARVENPTVAGYNPCLRVTLNDTTLDGKRLLNKQPVEEMADGRSHSTSAGELWVLPYSPDFTSPDADLYYAFRKAKVCLFDLKINDLLREGENSLTIESQMGGGLTNKIVVGDVRLVVRPPIVPKEKRKPPTGPLSLIQPATSFKVNYTLKENADGTMTLTIGKETFRVESQFSTPKPAWVAGSNTHFKLKRTLERRDEAILIRDTFTNLTDQNLPIMQRHTLTPLPSPNGRGAGGEGWKKAWLAGLSPASLTASSADPGNPTTLAVTAKAGVGLMPLDDVFQVHVSNFTTPDRIGIADNQLVLKPKAQHTVEWAIFPTTTPDYYAFLNAARRLRDVNFALEGPFAFLRADPRLTGKWTDDQLINFVRRKGAKYLCNGNDYPRYKGAYAHGTAFQLMEKPFRQEHIARLRRLVPEAKHMIYFHCFIDVIEDADRKYADARLLSSDGRQVDYGEPIYKIFVPTDTNQFGKDVAKNVDLILNPPPEGFGCEGVYWDELEYSRSQYHYDDFSKPDAGLPWDGVSADIDPKTMQIIRLKSSTTLISQPYRIALVKRILGSGKTLIGNGQPHTRTMMNMHFSRFVETGSISNCSTAQISTPIALGDHLTERNPEDCYRVMLKALNYGCVYHWYDDVHVGVPKYPTLTSYMFPITPIELHQGYIIGKERILTNRSGLFGWGDSSKHEVHVFDDKGKEAPDFKAPTVVKDGKTFTELRLAEDWSAAIVRKK